MGQGFTTAVLKADGKEPDIRDELTMSVKVGSSSSRNSRNNGVRFSREEVGLDFRSVVFSSDSVTGRDGERLNQQGGYLT